MRTNDHAILRREMRERGITQAELARRLDCSRQYVGMIVNGPPAATVRRFLDEVRRGR